MATEMITYADSVRGYVYDEQDMITAYSVAAMSACYSGHVGCLVRPAYSKNQIVAYNGPLPGYQTCYEAGGCLMRHDGTKDRCVRTIHAEMRAVAKAMAAGISLVDAIFIQTKQPCLQCAKLLSELGVGRVYYAEPNSTLPAVGVEMLRPMHVIRVDKPQEKSR